MRLEVVEGNAAGAQIRVSGELLIGRAADGDGGLGGDPEISRRHAIVRREAGGGLSIEDLGSMNGTFVNGSPVAERAALEPGDRIELGLTVLEVRPEDAQASPAAVEHGQAPPAGAAMEVGIGAEVAGYRIEEVLGRGGMGIVYRGVDERLGRSAAIKVIAPEQAGDAEFRQRFVAESQAAAAIDHPNVLPVYAAGEERGVLFLVTRMVEGADLGTLIEESGSMEPGRALDLVGQVGAALDAAHARDLIHRDVKPANVLVARDPRSGAEHCYLTDFGLAQQGDRRSRLTTSGQFVGTLDYIAPEQIQGEKVDGRADVYALAALFYECATGEPPFVRDSQAALLFAHLSDSPPPISEKLDAAPEALDEVLGKAMAKRADERYGSCGEFVEAARTALAGAAPPPAARPPAAAPADPPIAPAADEASPPVEPKGPDAPPPRAAGPRPARSRAVLAAGAAIAVLLLGGLAWAIFGTGGGGDGDGSTVALELSTETISAAREVAESTERLSRSVEGGGPAADLVEDFEASRRQAAGIARRSSSELDSGDPGREDLGRGARELEAASAALALVAAGPAAGGATAEARGAERNMEAALDALERALAAQQRAFEAEGAGEAAESVEASLAQLRGSRAQLAAPFEALVAAL